MPIEVLLRCIVLHALALAAVSKNLGGFSVGKSHRKGKSAVKLNLMKEELDGIGGSHSQRGKNYFRLGFYSGGDTSPDGGGFQQGLIVAHL